MVAPLWVLNTIKNLLLPEKVGQSSPNFFHGMLPPKTSHRAKFHQEPSNQLGEKRSQKLGLGQKKIDICHGWTEK